MRPTLLLIANPAAGRGRAVRLAEAAAALLTQRGFSAVVASTRGPGEAAGLTARAAERGAAVVVACGGDGTVGECAGALAGRATALGVLPCGRGNDLAASLGIPQTLDRGVDVIACGHERVIDLGVVNGRLFCTVVGIGFEARVIELSRRAGFRPLRGAAYAAAALAALARYRPPLARLSGDFGTREGRFLLVAVSNTGRYGGGMQIAPEAAPDDGLLDTCLVRTAPLRRLLRIFATVFRGGHTRFDEVELLRTARLEVETDAPARLVVDGDLNGSTPAAFAVAGLAVRVRVPGGEG